MEAHSTLTGVELFLFGSLISVFAVDILNFAFKRDPLSIYQPPVFVVLFLSYYCVFGPLRRIADNDWFHVLTDFRYAVAYGWAGALVFYLSMRLGYFLFNFWHPARRFLPYFDANLARNLGIKLCWVGFLFFFLANGLRVLAYINPLAVRRSGFFHSGGIDIGPLANYANAALNLLIPGILLQFTAWVRTRRKLISVVLWSFVALTTFISLGFRWRIVTLLLPMAMLWYLARGRSPDIKLLGPAGLIMLILSGIIEKTRSYGGGLNLDGLDGFNLGDLFGVGFNESSVFLVTGGLIANAPEHIPYVGFAPIISSLLFPIPSDLLSNKDTFEYLSNALILLFNSEIFAVGQAVLSFGEYYMMFGWVSLVLAGLFFGWLLRSLWNWFSLRRGETIAQVTYVATCGLLYMFISRGYLPQVILTFAFGSLPLFILYYRNAKSLSSRVVPVIPPSS